MSSPDPQVDAYFLKLSLLKRVLFLLEPSSQSHDQAFLSGVDLDNNRTIFQATVELPDFGAEVPENAKVIQGMSVRSISEKNKQSGFEVTVHNRLISLNETDIASAELASKFRVDSSLSFSLNGTSGLLELKRNDYSFNQTSTPLKILSVEQLFDLEYELEQPSNFRFKLRSSLNPNHVSSVSGASYQETEASYGTYEEGEKIKNLLINQTQIAQFLSCSDNQKLLVSSNGTRECVACPQYQGSFEGTTCTHCRDLWAEGEKDELANNFTISMFGLEYNYSSPKKNLAWALCASNLTQFEDPSPEIFTEGIIDENITISEPPNIKNES